MGNREETNTKTQKPGEEGRLKPRSLSQYPIASSLLLLLSCAQAESTEPNDTPPMPRAVPLSDTPLHAAEEHVLYSFIDNRLFVHRNERGPLLWLGGPEALKSVNPKELLVAQEIEGEPAAKLLSKTPSFPLRMEEGAHPLSLRLKIYSAAKGKLKASLQSHSLGEKALSVGWQVVEFPLDGLGLSPGESQLRLSLSAKNPALAWVHVVTDATADPHPTTLYKKHTHQKIEKNTLLLPEEGALSFYLMPPTGAELRSFFATTSTADCAVSLFAKSDDASKELLKLTLQSSAPWQESRVKLSEFTQKATRLSVKTSGCDGEVYWGEPALVHPGKAPEAKINTPVKRVILWVIDTQRADSYDFYNPKTRVRTPNMSRLSQEATVFESCLSAGNESQAGGASLITSTYPGLHQVFQEKNDLPLQLTTLAEALTSAGFASIGVSTNGYVSKGWQFDQGFGEFINLLHEDKPQDAGTVWKLGKTFLEKHPDQRVFLYLHTAEPHVPYQANKGIIDHYEKNYKGRYPYSVTGNETGAIRGGKITLTDEERAHIKALYDNEVELNDKYFGEMLKYLEDNNLTQDTLLVVTADHGEEMFEHGERRIGHKLSLVQEVIWIPFLVYAPGLYPAGGRVSVDVEGVDIMPTILEAAGAALPTEAQGAPLFALTQSPSAYPHAAISTWYLGRYATKMGRYKWVTRPGTEGILHDLVSDPGEKKDFSKRAPIARALLQEVFSFHHPFQKIWRKTEWGLPSNHDARFPNALEASSLKLP